MKSLAAGRSSVSSSRYLSPGQIGRHYSFTVP